MKSLSKYFVRGLKRNHIMQTLFLHIGATEEQFIFVTRSFACVYFSTHHTQKDKQLCHGFIQVPINIDWLPSGHRMQSGPPLTHY